jgi:hypothetical protein
LLLRIPGVLRGIACDGPTRSADMMVFDK